MRALELAQHPTWGRMVRQMMDLRAYHDTWQQYRRAKQNKKAELPDSLPFLRKVDANHLEMTKIRAEQRRRRREERE